jgi:capsular polysaccharide biosynthesis protein
MTRTIYQIDNRGDFIIFHWFMYMVSALKEVEHLPKPILFNIKDDNRRHEKIYEYINSTINLLKPDYEYVDKIQETDKIISIKEPYLISTSDVQDKYYHFLRNQILIKNNLENNVIPNKLTYISRCNKLFPKSSYARRQIINEDAFTNTLTEMGFNVIHLENYNLLEKIKIFQESKLIVTPNGGALIMGLFANKNIKVVEIHDNKSPNEDQYNHIFKVLDIPIIRYTNVTSVDINNNPILPMINVDYNYIVNDPSELVNFIKDNI